MEPGTIISYAGASTPVGYLPCDGAAVSRSVFAVLFSAIGVVWGAGDGATTFNVPNMAGRAPVGAGTEPGGGHTARVLGVTGGAESVALTVPQMPAHTHGFDFSDADGTDAICREGDGNSSQGTFPTTSTGGGQAHNNMPPFAVVRCLIKT